MLSLAHVLVTFELVSIFDAVVNNVPKALVPARFLRKITIVDESESQFV